MKNDNNRIEPRPFEDILADPSFSHVHDLMRYLQRTPSKDIFPKKYELSVLELVREETVAFFNREPNTPFKTVIATIIAGSNDDVSADLILKMTKKIIEKWEKLSVAIPKKKVVVVAAEVKNKGSNAVVFEK